MKNFIFVVLFVIVFILFVILYIIGFINYFNSDSDFLIKFNFLNFGSKLIAFFYLIILSIFFIVITSIMIRFIITPDYTNPKTIIKEIKSVDNISTTNKEISPEIIKNMVNISVNKVFSQNEKMLVKILETNLFQERKNELILSFSNMINDIFDLSSSLDLFEKVMYYGSTLANCKRSSIMICDKDFLTVFKTIGWGKFSKSDLENIKVPFGERVSGKIVQKKDFLYVSDISNFKEYDFPDSERYKSRSFVSFPVLYGDRVVAVLNFTDNNKESEFDIADVELLRILFKLTNFCYENIQIKKRISVK